MAQQPTDEELSAAQDAARRAPDSPETLVRLGNLLMIRGRAEQAAERYRQALLLLPDSPQIQCNLGSALRTLGECSQAVECYRAALRLRPDLAEVHNNLGNVLQQMGELDQAAQYYEAALALHVDYAEAHNNLAKVHGDRGEHDAAIAAYRRAVHFAPASARIHSNLVYALHFHPASTPSLLAQEHRRWNEIHAAPLARNWRRHRNDRSADRRLRIGYVSADFRQHPVGRFLLPLLGAHDKDRFEVYCYASQVHRDEMTQRLNAHADVWREVFHLDDAALAEQIRSDGIDILVDLSLHMAGNRLLTFARRPAPVQITYLAYCSGSGMAAMDYRLTTRALDPAAEREGFYAEKSVDLPRSYWCYEPGCGTPEVKERSGGSLTFGCLNQFCKVTEQMLEVWAEMLGAVPDSRLMMYCPAGSARRRVRKVFEDRAIAPTRLSFADFVPLDDYFELYRGIDIGLDPFPYGGGTTTCDALWMGVPVISRAGATAVSRSGAELLGQVGLGDLLADTPEQYVRVAIELARNADRRKEIRSSLRQTMQKSAVMDAGRFARDLEAVYREVWGARRFLLD